jgi:hypothetical protein
VFEIAKTASGYASTPATLFSVNDENGIYPGGLLIDAAGDLFGLTGGGGANGDGSVFEIAKTASGYASAPTTLVSFGFGTAIRSSPVSLIVDAAGDFFGTTGAGGRDGGGTVFEVTDGGFQDTCYLAGTRIATPTREVLAEDLATGDRVTTLFGPSRRVCWIGHRHLDFTRHPTPDRVRPIRIRASAFADNVPHRDLFVSPDHAVLLDGVLIPARLLLNGSSIQLDTERQAVTYYHVELDTHDILLAENLPAESYLDTRNRAMFENSAAPVLLHPDLTAAQARREAESCAPFVDDPARIEPLWRALAIRAIQLGWQLPPEPETTTDPSLCLLIDGRRLPPLGIAQGHYAFMLPRAPHPGPPTIAKHGAERGTALGRRRSPPGGHAERIDRTIGCLGVTDPAGPSSARPVLVAAGVAQSNHLAPLDQRRRRIADPARPWSLRAGGRSGRHSALSGATHGRLRRGLTLGSPGVSLTSRSITPDPHPTRFTRAVFGSIVKWAITAPSAVAKSNPIASP